MDSFCDYNRGDFCILIFCLYRTGKKHMILSFFALYGNGKEEDAVMGIEEEKQNKEVATGVCKRTGEKKHQTPPSKH